VIGIAKSSLAIVGRDGNFNPFVSTMIGYKILV